MIKHIEVRDVFAVNTYFMIDDVTKSGFLIDPGAQPKRILETIRQNHWTIERILLTHGHFDHTGAVSEISEVLDIPYSIHRDGECYLKDARLNLSAYCERNVILPNADYFDDGNILSLRANPAVTLEVIHVPGHTPDSVVFYDRADKVAFVGDTIFRDSPGTSRYPGGNEEELYNSICYRVLTLPDDTILLSGHSEPTTVGRERPLYS